MGLLFLKESGVPIPVPGDLLVLGAGVATASQPLLAAGVLGGIIVVGVAGGGLQFGLVRGALRRTLLALLGRLGVSAARLDTLASRLERGGARSVAIARATPGVRIGAIAASGLAGLPYRVFLPGLVAGNTVFVGAHFALGYVVGAPALGIAAGLGSLATASVAVVALAVLGAVGWRFIVRRRAAAPTGGLPRRAAAFAAWTDAACPACLVLAVVDRTPDGS